MHAESTPISASLGDKAVSLGGDEVQGVVKPPKGLGNWFLLAKFARRISTQRPSGAAIANENPLVTELFSVTNGEENHRFHGSPPKRKLKKQGLGFGIQASSTSSLVSRAYSSVGRAPPRQGGGHWFEPSIAH